MSEREPVGNARAIERRLINVREAAQYIGRTEKSVRHLVGRRKLRCIRADGRVMLDLIDLDAWITMNRR
jgi:Helix-turn-helix domain